MLRIRLFLTISLTIFLLAAGNGVARALTLGPDFAADYTAASLGSVPGLPPLYGGLTILRGNSSKLLIGGNANTASGLLYTIEVARDADDHIVGFVGSASPYGTVGTYNDGGVVYGPGGVLFTAQWPVNMLGQTKPGNMAEDRVDDLGPLGIGGSSISALNFVPPGFGGAGKMKVVSWVSGNWYDVAIAPDGAGTFNLVSATQVDVDPSVDGIQSLPGGPEGFVYIPAGNPGFTVDSMLVSDFSSDQVSAYELDGDGNPIAPNRRDFLTDLNGAEGAAIDPMTGDFLFSTFGGGDQVVVVKGFTVPPPPIPVPAALPLLASALGILGGVRWLNRRRTSA